MAHRLFLAGACGLALLATACHPKPGSADPSAVNDSPSAFPQWAFPGPKLESVPGSAAKFSEVQMFDRTTAVDWFPASHPAMPDVVKGRQPVYACGFCHLPQGAGRDENAALAGLPYKYLLQQIADFKSGARKTPDPKFGAAVNMQATIKQVSDADAQAAAKYYSGLTYTKHLKLVESDEAPHFSANAFVYEFDETAPRVPLGQRIIEGPDDFKRFEMRDPNMTYTAYVPVGSIALGTARAKGDGAAKPACELCHGPGLKGSDIAPPIAGRLPTGLFRQLYAFQTGARNGPNAVLMKPIVAALSRQEMINLSAYIASLDP